MTSVAGTNCECADKFHSHRAESATQPFLESSRNAPPHLFVGRRVA